MTEPSSLHELRAQLEQLRKENQQLKTVVDRQQTLLPEHFSCHNFCDTLPFAIRAAGLGLWSVDLQTLSVNWSREMCTVLGLQRSEFLLHNSQSFTIQRFLEYIHPEDRTRVGEEVEQSIAQHSQFNCVFRMLHADGHYKWIHSIGDTEYDLNDRPLHMTGFVWDISEHKSVEEHLRELTITDALTGLYNRRHLSEVLEQELRYSRRFGTEMSVVSVDIDHFKAINDHYGHEMGDRFLKALAALMKQAFRGVDSVFRRGGEEFIAVLPNANVRDARNAAERLRQSFRDISIDGAQATLSAGVASSHQISPEASHEVLLEASDQALYYAKNAGRDRTHIAIRQTEAAQL